MSVREIGSLRTDYAPLNHLEDEIRSYDPLPVNHLELIASHFRSMNYGDFIQFTTDTQTDPGNLWKWATR